MKTNILYMAVLASPITTKNTWIIMTSKHYFVRYFVENIITSEEDFKAYDDALPINLAMIYFKMVGIGPGTLEQAQYKTNNVIDIINKQLGYFLIGDDGLREAMHDLVDRFCNAREQKYESKNKEI